MLREEKLYYRNLRKSKCDNILYCVDVSFGSESNLLTIVSSLNSFVCEFMKDVLGNKIFIQSISYPVFPSKDGK